MAEARYTRDDQRFKIQAASTIDAYAVVQLPTGEAAFLDSGVTVSSGNYTENLRTRGKVRVLKATSVVMLTGQEVFWDHSANNATYLKSNDRDFFLGTVAEDASASDIEVEVDLNKRGHFDIELGRAGDFFLTALIGTVGYNTMGLQARGGGQKFILSTANEAQKIDLLSVDGWAPGANAIVEGVFRIVSGGAAAEPDFNIGVANATHATTADDITESFFVHIDGNSTALRVESDDGTNEVAAADTSLTYTAGSTVATRVHFLLDTRELADMQAYINGANVLPSSVFRLDNATGPLKLLAHLEKTAAATVFEVDIEKLRVWFSEQ